MTTGQICVIEGSLESVGLGALDGKLVATIDVAVPLEPVALNPVLVLPSSREFIITGGDLSGAVPAVQIRETETSQLTIKLEFFKKIPGSTPAEYEDTAIWTIFPQIPNQPSADIAELADTGFTNDTLATGAIFIAKQLLTNPGVNSYIAQFVLETLRITRGLFDAPTDPAPQTGDIWERIDTLERFTYIADTVNKWFRNPNFYRVYNTFSASSVVSRIDIDQEPFYTQFLIRRLLFTYYVQTTNNSSNYWTFKIQRKLWNNATPVDLPAPLNTTFSTQSLSANTRYQDQSQISDFLTLIDATTTEYFILNVTKVGSPGTLQLNCSMQLHYVWNSGA